MNESQIALGIDLGGTKIEIIAIDPNGNELIRRRVATPQGDYRATLASIGELVNGVENQLGVRGSIGIGTPGALSLMTGRLKNSNSICLNDQPLKHDLEALLQREIRIANDANCFALSEAMDGAAVGGKIVFGVILGTGVGGGVVIDRQVLTGANAIAGEWGHNPLPLPQSCDLPLPACYCGRMGCIETYLSGPGAARDYLATTGETLDPPAIFAKANENDQQCQATLQRYEERLARALAQIINILDPDVIVLGGGMSNIGRIYDNVPSLWVRYVFSDQVTTKLVRNLHGDSSGVRGAAWLWR